MDTEHWFAPFADRTGGNNAEQYLYLSTNRTTPFNVDIYNNNTIYQTVSISKGNPGIVELPRDIIITSDGSQLFKTSSMGLHLVGEFKFYAHLRFTVTNHGEIVTSKGKAGLGTEFIAFTPVQTPVSKSGNDGPMNATVGIIATEDYTTIKISNFRNNLILNNATNEVVNNATVKTISLNKGESYILEDLFSKNNSIPEGFLGLNIKSDKPISVTNGCFNIISPNGSNNDVYMDQASPIDRLGKEYIAMSGNGALTQNNNPTNMEEVVVVASEDNTSVSVNGGNTITLAKKGDYYTFGGTNYKFITTATANSTVYDSYNMYLKSDKNIYAYQLLAGSPGSTFPSGGMNILPSLQCLLPNNIEEFAKVNEIGTQSGFKVRLNIIAQKNANVVVNGNTINGTYGPYPVTGTTEWESYMIPEMTGNVSISTTNDKAITAGIAGGSGAVGYGGYFAGFNSSPVISKGGDCDQKNITLEVDNTYNHYQWYINGVPYTANDDYSNTDGTSYIIHPKFPGNYYVSISKTDCGTMDSPVFTLPSCSVKSSLSQTIGACDKKIIILPKFTTSTQQVNPASVKILSQPTNGTVSVNNTTGEITYILTNLSATTDKFVYYFEGVANGFPDSEIVTMNISVKELIVYNGVSKACVNSGIGRFNIDEVKLTDDTTATYRYFKTFAAANSLDTTQEITTLHPYLSNVGTVYVRITDIYGCYKIAEIELRDSQPNVNPNNYDSSHCDSDLDGKIDIKFSDITPLIVTNYQDFTIEYYDNAGFTGSPLPDLWSYTKDTDIYVRVFSQTSCVTAKGIIHFKFGDKISVKDITAIVCDGDYNNTENINLGSYLPQITSETGYTPTYHKTWSDAALSQNSISANQTITQNESFYVRFEKSGICPNVAAINLKLNQAKKSTVLKDVTICEGSTILLDVGAGFDHVYWNGDTTTDSQTFSAGVGSYFVDLVSNGCTYRQNVTVSGSPKAVFTISSFNSTNCDEDFDGKINIDFSLVTPQIISNSTLFNIRYYDDIAKANAGGNNNLPNNWSYTTNTTIYVRVDSNYCPTEIKPIDFKFGNQVPLITTSANSEICDDDLDGSKSVNLSDFVPLFTADNSVVVSYFDTLLNAQKNTNPISNPINLKNTQTFYLRFSKSGFCSIIGTLNLTLKSPKASDVLKDKQICPNTTTTLDAGPGFSSYVWSTGATTPSIQNIKPGNYWVTLTYNGCPYKQNVTVTEVDMPIITKIEIQGSTATISVTGGNPPYEYSLDGIQYQTSNIFTNLTRGSHTVYVISKDQCEPVTKDFVIIKLLNVITPNGDGMNDVLDYSDLSNKADVKFSIFDRYGRKLFDGTSTNRYSWDGTDNGRQISTGTYWYQIEWKDFGAEFSVKYTGWIFVKH